MFPFGTRQLFFKLITFVGSIDIYRSIFFLKKFIQERGGTIPDERKIIKIHKQAATVDRKSIIPHAQQILKSLNKRAFLDIRYRDEVGTG